SLAVLFLGLAARHSVSRLADWNRTGSQNTFFHHSADFHQRLVLDLANAFLGHTDNLPDFLEGQRALFFLLPVKATANDRFFNLRQVGEIAIDDRLQLIDAVFFDGIATT